MVDRSCSKFNKENSFLYLGVLMLALIATKVHSQAVMMLPGAFEVGTTGSASYVVPIEVPPGTGGMNPTLTLEYDSGHGNGVVGVGWTLGGLSSITRCPKNLAQDSAIAPVAFEPYFEPAWAPQSEWTGDRFCLDGQRLVIESGSYGAAGSVYRTELEGFTRITAHGQSGNGPAYFTAQTRSGQVIEFGNTSDSSIELDGASHVRIWMVNKVSDTVGNYLTVSYATISGDSNSYPDRVDYTGNSAASLQPYNHVEFSYETRPDIVPAYLMGGKLNATQRLKAITTYESGNAVKTYKISYDASPREINRSIVTQIELCAEAGGVGDSCLPATTFDVPNVTLQRHVRDWEADLLNDMHDVGEDMTFLTGDWNGDGYTDIMWYVRDGGENKWFVNTTASPGGAAQFGNAINELIPSADLDAVSMTAYLGDFNADGLVDVFSFDAQTRQNNVWLNNGDMSFQKISEPISISDTVSTQGPTLGDFNGDGRTDVLMYRASDGANYWFLSDGTGGFEPRQINKINPAQIDVWYGQPEIGDWNGDGVTDLAWLNPAGVTPKFYITKPNLNFVSATTTLLFKAGNSFFVDWNGDGLTDHVLIENLDSEGDDLAFRFDFNSGDVAGLFITESHTAPGPIPVSVETVAPYVGDWNGDGVPDLMFHGMPSGEQFLVA